MDRPIITPDRLKRLIARNPELSWNGRDARRAGAEALAKALRSRRSPGFETV